MKASITEEQARLLGIGQQDKLVFGQRLPSQKPKQAKPVVARRAIAAGLTENQVEDQVTGFLRAKGWVVTRNHVGTFIGIGPLLQALDRGQAITKDFLFKGGRMTRIGEKGEADWSAERLVQGHTGTLQRFDIELKRPGKQPSEDQVEWLRRRKMLGYVAVWFDRYEDFIVWYSHTWE